MMEYREEDDGQNNQLVRTWNRMKEKLNLIYDEDPQVNYEFLAKCYDKVFNYLMHVNREQIEQRNAGHQEFHPGKTYEISLDLYLVLIGFINDKTDEFAEKFIDVSNDELFALYATEWRRYKMVHKKIQYIFRYLDRYFVPIARNDNNLQEVYEVYRFALLRWFEKVFISCQVNLIHEILKFMKAERDGKAIDSAMVSCASKSFIELGAVYSDEPMKLYRPLEVAFISATKDFYRERSRKLMIELNVVRSITFEQYMDAIYQVLQQEAERVKTYLDESSVASVIRICEECLILEHKERFNKSFEDYLKAADKGNIAKIFDLISRFPKELEIFIASFRTHIEKEGDNAIGRLDNILNVDPKTYVEAILVVYISYESLVMNELRDNETFKQALDNAAKKIINDNPVTQASDYDDRNAELLAKYCDTLLSNDSGVRLPDNELENALKHVLIYFKLLNDKDGFQKFYENITARRLIFSKSVSDDMEDFMILSLKDYFGEQDSHVLKRISENIKASQDINVEFHKIVEKERGKKILRNFSVVILADKHWPYKTSSPYASSKQFMENLPVALEPAIERFSRFYREKFTGEKQPRHRKIDNLGRKLQWLHNLGKGELDAYFLGKRYILQVGAFQMAVLMQFNENSSYTFEELKKNTGIMTAPAAFLQDTLSKLFELRILTCTGDYKSLQSKTCITLNIDFQSKRVRINLDHVIDAESEINRKEVLKHIDTDRELLTQCAIVRVMKREKRLHRTDLMGQVIEELKKRFKPEVEMLKRSLSLSIGKDFIAVDKKDSNNYVYVD